MLQMVSNRLILPVIFFIVSLFIPAFTCASAIKKHPTPEGFWLIQTAVGGHDRSIVELRKDASGHINGYLVATFFVEGRPWSTSDKCVKCSYGFEGKSLENMEIITSLKKSGNDWDSLWSGGTVYNADTDKQYNLKVKQVDAGNRLQITGCMMSFGIPCKSSHWYRVDEHQLHSYLEKAKLDKKQHTRSIDRSQ